MADSFEIEIATPERSVVKETVVRAQIPGKDGYMGILPDHAALVSELGIGILSYATAQGIRSAVAVHGGFVEVLDNHVSVLADIAEPGNEIDLERAQAARERASREMTNSSEGADPASALAAVMRAEARIEAAKKAQAKEE
jgi:F-type H+-transporting ATPase subunit epsilon